MDYREITQAKISSKLADPRGIAGECRRRRRTEGRQDKDESEREWIRQSYQAANEEVRDVDIAWDQRRRR